MKFKETHIEPSLLKPSDRTKEFWLFCRKHSDKRFINYGNYSFPGKFIVTDYKNDFWFFLIAITAEIIFLASIPIIIDGFDILLGFAGFFLVVLDFIGAYFAHKYQDKICIFKIEIEQIKFIHNTFGTGLATELEHKKTQLNKVEKSFSRKIGKIIIIISAALKIIGFAILNSEIDSIAFALFALYSFVAYIHITKTGFFVSGFMFYRNLKKDYNLSINQDRAWDQISNPDNPDNFDYYIIQDIPQSVRNIYPIKRKVFNDRFIYDSLEQRQDGVWQIKKWKHHFWDDNDVEILINSVDVDNNALTIETKAFLFYFIVKNILK
jgi:hypothetical protein